LFTNKISAGRFSRKKASIPPSRQIKAKAKVIFPRYQKLLKEFDVCAGLFGD